MKSLILVIALALSGGFGQTGPELTAGEQLRQIRKDLQRTHAANDAAGYVANAQKMNALLNASPNSLLQLMSAQGFSGNTNGALETFREFVRMGQSNEDLLQLPQFGPLGKDPRFAAIHSQMVENGNSVSHASIAFSLKDAGLNPEDIDFDPATNLFYITSVLEKKIRVVDMSGSAKVFALAPDGWPVMAVKVDRQRHILWVTEVALDGYDLAPREDWGRSAILIYDLETHKLLRRIEGPAKSALGDMTLTSEGDAIVSDGDGGGVYRVNFKTLAIERLDAGEFISPQTPAMSADGRSVFVPDYVRGMGILNLTTRHVVWIPMNGTYALSGIDGLYLDGNTLIATQNGTSPERVIAFGLNASLEQVTSESIIERSTPTLGDPTHGVIVDGTFYYIANSGWDTLDDHGHRKPNAKPTPALVMKVRLHN